MPVGLYTRKGAKGRRMYFRDGSSSAKSLTMPLANVGDDLPGKVCGVKPHVELSRAKDQGEEIWHDENPQCRIHLLRGWLQA